jgi:hypothetical protein
LTQTFTLTHPQRRRLEKLAREAGRTPAETFRFVLRDGFEFCEWEVRESRAADAETKKNGAVRHEDARHRARQVIDAAHCPPLVPQRSLKAK